MCSIVSVYSVTHLPCAVHNAAAVEHLAAAGVEAPAQLPGDATTALSFIADRYSEAQEQRQAYLQDRQQRSQAAADPGALATALRSVVARPAESMAAAAAAVAEGPNGTASLVHAAAMGLGLAGDLVQEEQQQQQQ